MGDGRSNDREPGKRAAGRAGAGLGAREASKRASVWPAVRLVANAAGRPIAGVLGVRVIVGAMAAVELTLLGVVVDGFASTGDLPLGPALGLVLAFAAGALSAHVADAFRLNLIVTPLVMRRHIELLGLLIGGGRYAAMFEAQAAGYR